MKNKNEKKIISIKYPLIEKYLERVKEKKVLNQSLMPQNDKE